MPTACEKILRPVSSSLLRPIKIFTNCRQRSATNIFPYYHYTFVSECCPAFCVNVWLLVDECRMQGLTSRLCRQIFFGLRTTKPIYNRPMKFSTTIANTIIRGNNNNDEYQNHPGNSYYFGSKRMRRQKNGSRHINYQGNTTSQLHFPRTDSRGGQF